MVTNFEDETKPLNEDELALADLLVMSFKNRTKENPIKSADIISKVNAYLENNAKHIKTKLTDRRIRKICNYIRVKGMIPLIATSNGYYVSYDKTEILAQINSLRDRASAIVESSIGLEKFLMQ